MTIMLGLTWQSIHDGIQRSGNEPHMDYDQRSCQGRSLDFLGGTQNINCL